MHNGPSWLRYLAIPWIDKAIAILALIPFFYDFYNLVHDQRLLSELPLVVYLIDCGLIVFTMILRRAPVRVAGNPFYWLLTFVATYWGILGAGFVDNGVELVPHWVIGLMASVGLILYVWGRFSLGRNIGFVPAQRQLVVHGAYRYVRHPIYAAVFITVVAVILRHYSLGNLLFFAVGIFWFALKSVVEENFLKQDARYAEYMGQVRWRWIPRII